MDIGGLWARALEALMVGPGAQMDADSDRKKRLQEGASMKVLNDYAKGVSEQRKDLAKKLAKKKRLASPDLDM